MQITIDPELKKTAPQTALGLVTAHVRTQASSEELLALLKSRENEILQLPEPKLVLESAKILATRRGYKALGKDPSRYRGSAEALLRRIISGKSFPQINNVVDIINLLSVESRFPVGLYDLDHVKGDVVFRVGRAAESYKGIGKYDLNLAGLPVFCDETGPFGSPTSDSERTMVTPVTTRIALIFVSFGGNEGLESSCQRMADLLGHHASATAIQSSIVY
ncbi:MAG: phenylalanine--tRNA ligase beta subunit-related protein [Candidatus Acidiferrum sp.]